MATITPIDAPLGAEVRGIDLARDLDDGLMRTLTTALYDHRVLVIKDQKLDKDQYLRFGRQWGAPIPHVLDHMRMAGYPEMMTVGNTEARDRKDIIRNGAALWHTDQSYERQPASATMLYSLIAPRVGGETRYANMVAAYDALDDATRAEYDGYMIGHLYGAGRRRPDELEVNPLINDDQVNRVPSCWHPLVTRHPVTGRKAIYAVGHGAFRIEGMENAKAEALIDRIKNHCVEERFVYRHKYAVGDLVIFDTLSTMHAATPMDIAETTEADNARLLWRISVRGLPSVHQHLAA